MSLLRLTVTNKKKRIVTTSRLSLGLFSRILVVGKAPLASLQIVEATILLPFGFVAFDRIIWPGKMEYSFTPDASRGSVRPRQTS